MVRLSGQFIRGANVVEGEGSEGDRYREGSEDYHIESYHRNERTGLKFIIFLQNAINKLIFNYRLPSNS